MKITFQKINGIAFPLYGTLHCLRCDQIVLSLTKRLKRGTEVMPMHTRHCPFRGYEDTDVFRHEFYTRKRSAKDFLLPKRTETQLVAERVPVPRKPPKSVRPAARTVTHS